MDIDIVFKHLTKIHFQADMHLRPFQWFQKNS